MGKQGSITFVAILFQPLSCKPARIQGNLQHSMEKNSCLFSLLGHTYLPKEKTHIYWTELRFHVSAFCPSQELEKSLLLCEQ